MKKDDNDREELTLDRLGEVRRRSDSIARALRSVLSGHIETLRPLLAPGRTFGKYAGAPDVAGATKAFEQLLELYKGVAGLPFVLPRELDQDWLASAGDRVELYPWQYVHEIPGEAPHRIMITSPISHQVTYRSGYSLSQLRDALEGRVERRREFVRQFVINCLMMTVVFDRNPGLVKLLEGLRYTVDFRTIDFLGALKLPAVTSMVEAFRPSDELILAATGFSGVPAFHEVIVLDSLARFPDALKDQLIALAG